MMEEPTLGEQLTAKGAIWFGAITHDPKENSLRLTIPDDPESQRMQGTLLFRDILELREVERHHESALWQTWRRMETPATR